MARPKNPIKIVSVYSQKGGVGKSTAALLLAHYLAEQENKRVALFDLDLTGTSLLQAIPASAVQDFGAAAAPKPFFLEEYLTHYPSAMDGGLERMPAAARLHVSRGEILLFPSEPKVDEMSELLPFLYREPQTWLFRDRLIELFEHVVEQGAQILILDNSPGRGAMVKVAQGITADFGGIHLGVTSADRQDLFAFAQMVTELATSVITSARDADTAPDPNHHIVLFMNRVPDKLHLSFNSIRTLFGDMDLLLPALGTGVLDQPENWIPASHADLLARIFNSTDSYPRQRDVLVGLLSRLFTHVWQKLAL